MNSFAEDMKGRIRSAQSQYPTHKQGVAQDGYNFFHVFFEMENGQAISGITEYHFKASTDAEVKAMWGMDKTLENGKSIPLGLLATAAQASAEERYFEMLDEAHRKEQLRNKDKQDTATENNLHKKRLAAQSYGYPNEDL